MGEYQYPEAQTVAQSDVYEPPMEYVHQEIGSISDKARIYHAIVRWTILVLVFLLPLFFLPWTSSILELNKQFLLVIGTGIAMIAWLLGVVISGQVSYRATMLDKGVLAFLGATIVAAALSISPVKSIFGMGVSLSESLVSIASLTILYFLAVNTFEDRGRALRSTLLVSMTIALVFGLAQLFTLYVLPFSFAHSRAFNSLGSINVMGVAAAMMLPLFIRMRVRIISSLPWLDVMKLGMIASLAILAILNWWILWAIAFTGIAPLIVLDSIGMAVNRKEGTPFRMTRFLLPMTVIVVGAFLMIVNFSYNPVKSQLPVEVAPGFSFSGRVAQSVLQESLITGYGPENFSIAFDKYGAAQLANTNLSNAKFFDAASQVFNTVVHGGIISALAILLLLGSIIRMILGYKQAIMTHATPADELSGMLAAVIAGCGAFFLYPFNLTLMALFYMVLALTGLLVWGATQRIINIEDRPAFSLGASLGFIAGLVIVLTGTYFLSTRYAADAQYVAAAKSTTVDAASNTLVKAINWDGHNDIYYRSLSQVILAQLQDEIGKKDKDANRATRVQNLMDSAIRVAQGAVQVEARESANWFNLGTVYQSLIGLRENADKSAEEAYLKAGELRPGDASFQNRIGAMYMAKADLLRQLSRSAGSNAASYNQEADASLIKAEDAFKKAIEQSPSFGLAIYNLGSVYDRQGKVNEAVKEIEKIIPFNANDPDLVFELGLLYLRANRKADAMAAFERVVQISPTYANAHWYLALLYEERKEIPSAIEQLELILAVEANKDNQTVLDKLNALKAGQIPNPPTKAVTQKPLR
jgi:tetratricopeptide (TPR) repeat protein